MKCSLVISNFLEEISSLSHSVVFLYFFALITEEGFLSLLAILWNSAFKWIYLSFSPLPFASLLFMAVGKGLQTPPHQPLSNPVSSFVFLHSIHYIPHLSPSLEDSFLRAETVLFTAVISSAQHTVGAH